MIDNLILKKRSKSNSLKITEIKLKIKNEKA
jgi:hypothetical protein